MKSDRDLREKIAGIDGRGYKAYKSIAGQYNFWNFVLLIDHVQGDPYAAPSRIRVRVKRRDSGFGDDTTRNRSREIALRDFLTRSFFVSCRKFSRGNRGIGQSGLITVEKPLQEILERSSMVVNEQFVEARFFMGLPAVGRRISARDAGAMFFDELPRIVRGALFMENLNAPKLYRHLETSEDADFLRAALAEKRLVGFVARDACLPRASGIDPRPLASGDAVPFEPPPSRTMTVLLPNSGEISGLGIPNGITLIVGGGYHGKSTLLNALEYGVYNHIPGDGRERVVTVEHAVKIKAADGRSIAGTDISPFISNLPMEKDTRSFSTGNASGSTSQAAGITEAIEAGAKALFLDEDTSATNFMIRDFRMQQLVAKEKEPITPFIDKVRQLYLEKGISTVLVMGGSGDYFSVADHVIQMTNYQPYDVTERAKEIAESVVTGRTSEGGGAFGSIADRVPEPGSFDPQNDAGRLKISPRGRREILFGKTIVDCWDLEQIVEVSQTRAIGYAIHYARHYIDGERTLAEVLSSVLQDLNDRGLDILSPYVSGDLSRFRRFELAAAINRMRTLAVKQKEK